VKALNTIIKYALIFVVGAMFILTTIQVIMRYGFNNALSWSEELVRFLFIWATLLGAAIGLKEHIHIGIDTVVSLLPAALRRYTDTLVHLIDIAFCIFLIVVGWSFVGMTHTQFSPALDLRMSYVHFAIPLGALLCILYSALEIFQIWKKRKTQGEEG